jgi:hypothetical protein
MENIFIYLSSVISSGLVSSAVLFVGKTWISERLKNAIKGEYDEKLETHKAQLKREYDREIEHLKAQLQIAAAERGFRFSHVFEQAAKTIATIYGKLLELHKAVEDYTQIMEPPGNPNRKELAQSLKVKSDEFFQYYRPNKIYIPKATAEKIRLFSNALHSLVLNFNMAVAVDRAQIRKPEIVESRHKALEELYQKVPELLASLEHDFQATLGFPDAANCNPKVSTYGPDA